MAEHVVEVTPHIRPDGRKHPNAFDAYLGDRLVCTSETPLFSSARILLEDKTAHPDDTIVMRHRGIGSHRASWTGWG